MEHSILHALQLSGTVVALGGAILMIAFMFPALRAGNLRQPPPQVASQLGNSVATWTFRAGLFAIFAALMNLIVDVAEIDSRTVFGGFNPQAVWDFATITTVGHLSLCRIGALAFTTIAARLKGRWKWLLVLLGGFAAALFESLVSHAAAQPNGRSSAIIAELSHVLAGSLWMGVLVHLLLARRAILARRDDRSLAFFANILARFSPVALTFAGLLGLSGFVLTIRYLCTPAAVPTSAYGFTFSVKMGLMLPLLYAAYVNYKQILPGLRVAGKLSDELRAELLGRFGKTLELEVTAGVLVLTLAGILGSVSPPEQWGTLRLTSAQVNALTSPHLPITTVADPETFYGAPERTVADLHYSEFTHSWSGVMVLLLGCCWLVEIMGGQAGFWAARAWPLLFIPFPFFIAVAADPEVWLLRKVTFWETIQDPQLLEHQLGAMFAFILVALGWMDRRRPADQRPLGYSLPVVMILGSLLLLGHAHSNFSSTQDLTNLINVQHAIFGAFGLFAGLLRWLTLRGLVPWRPMQLVWPGLVIGLGLFMAFCYREAV
jgi:putative copper export protein